MGAAMVAVGQERFFKLDPGMSQMESEAANSCADFGLFVA
jgi:hypothetical protein